MYPINLGLIGPGKASNKVVNTERKNNVLYDFQYDRRRKNTFRFNFDLLAITTKVTERFNRHYFLRFYFKKAWNQSQ